MTWRGSPEFYVNRIFAAVIRRVNTVLNILNFSSC